MKSNNGNLPAMPITVTDTYCNFVNTVGVEAEKISGLTKREQFAAMAMQGLLSHNSNWRPTSVAKASVDYADALLAELEKTQ